MHSESAFLFKVGFSFGKVTVVQRRHTDPTWLPPTPRWQESISQAILNGGCTASTTTEEGQKNTHQQALSKNTCIPSNCVGLNVHVSLYKYHFPEYRVAIDICVRFPLFTIGTPRVPAWFSALITGWLGLLWPLTLSDFSNRHSPHRWVIHALTAYNYASRMHLNSHTCVYHVRLCTPSLLLCADTCSTINTYYLHSDIPIQITRWQLPVTSVMLLTVNSSPPNPPDTPS